MDNRTSEKASITVAAKALNVSVKTIQRWIKSGKISSIREDNRIFIPVDEIRAKLKEKKANIEDIDQDKKEVDQSSIGQAEDKNINVIPIDRTHYEGLLTRLGQLEANQQLLLEYKEGLERKNREFEEAKAVIEKANREAEERARALQEKEKELSEIRAGNERLKNRSLWARLWNKK